ncbi:MAG: hypothetical protein KDE45_08050 [Caldilineaceae bacterium]|nr:hypothetical protein [Caldilineaceae bacterium]
MSPLDLLSVSGHEQDIIRCLVRRPRLTMHEIAKFTQIPLEELERLLNSMVRDARLTRDSDSTFQVPLGGKTPRRENNGTSLLGTLFG